MRHFIAEPVARLEGRVRVPGDKSISHRAIMLGAIATGHSEIRGFLPGEDCLATLAAVQAMGVSTVRHATTHIGIEGVGLRGLANPGRPLDMGNSGTAMRLLTGLLCGQGFDSVLVGDESLSRRPMERVAEPLRRMGARIETTRGCPPLRITGGQTLRGVDYEMPVASAQVKSAVLLAGLFADGETSIVEPAVTRDHTERMLEAFGQTVRRQGSCLRIAGAGRLRATVIDVPGDLSSAAFLILAGTLAAAGELVIEGVGINPTRTGILEILRLMGADIGVEPQTSGSGMEPVARLIVRPAQLHGIVVPPRLVPLAIDEFPALFVAAAMAQGTTVITGASELRHKESDRIAVMAAGLRALGITVVETPDGARIDGARLGAGEIDSRGDHRVAMAFAAGAVSANGPVRILDTANVATSFPGFVELCSGVGMQVREEGA